MDARMTRLPRARNQDMLTRDLPDGVLVYATDRHRCHSLNRTAALVWQHCDGQTTVEEMVGLLRKLDLPASEEVVWLALARLEKAQLLQDRLAQSVEGISRRSVIRKLGKAAGIAALIPVVTSITAPNPAMAASFATTSACPNGCTGSGTGCFCIFSSCVNGLATNCALNARCICTAGGV